MWQGRHEVVVNQDDVYVRFRIAAGGDGGGQDDQAVWLSRIPVTRGQVPGDRFWAAFEDCRKVNALLRQLYQRCQMALPSLSSGRARRAGEEAVCVLSLTVKGDLVGTLQQRLGDHSTRKVIFPLANAAGDSLVDSVLELVWALVLADSSVGGGGSGRTTTGGTDIITTKRAKQF